MQILFDDEDNPILDQFSEEGFVDLTFKISNLSEDGLHYHFHMSASYSDKSVGMDVVVFKKIQGGFDKEMNLVQKHVYREGVRFLRSGPESDRLISAIGKLYDIKPSRKRMVVEESFTAIALHQGKIDLKKQCVKLKLFGKDGEPFDEDAYYESFFNIDLSQGFVFWNEKDQDYREPLIRALSATKTK